MSDVVRFPQERVKGRVLAMQCEVYQFEPRGGDQLVPRPSILFWPVAFLMFIGFLSTMRP